MAVTAAAAAVMNEPPCPAGYVPLRSITIGNRKDRDVGALVPLMRSIGGDGLRHPLVITTSHRLVLGRRRLEAMRRLGWHTGPAVPVTGIWEALEYLTAEQADPAGAQPLTVAEAMGLDAALRELDWWPRAAPGVPRDTNLGNNRRKQIGELLGMNAKQYSHARELWAASRGYKETLGHREPVSGAERTLAARLLDQIASAGDVEAAYRRYRNGARLSILSPSVHSRRPPQRTQASRIEHSLAALAGLSLALEDTGPVDPGTPPETLARWQAEFEQAWRRLRTFRRNLNKEQQR